VTRGEHVWVRAYIGWQIAFWSFLGGSALIVALSGQTPARKLVGLGALAVIGLAFAVLRPQPTDGAALGPGTLYVGFLIVGVGVLLAAAPQGSPILFVAYSQIWMYSGSTRRAALLTVVFSASVTAGFVAAAGVSTSTLLAFGPLMVLSVVVSVLMGVWISRIIDQSTERASLIEELEATRSVLFEAEHARGVLAERERIAREVHDTLAQGFTSIIMLSQAGPTQLPTIESVARANLAEARALVAAFAPVDLSDSSLTEALQRLAARFSTETGVAVAVTGSLTGLSRDREVVLLRSAQEALANVRRHASARSVSLALEGSSVEIRDDGIGFAPSVRPGFGLAGMRSRVGEVGGSVSVTSAPGAGTTVKVKV
jgi:signal transduction histidine kinase